jgi:hypothetical protein
MNNIMLFGVSLVIGILDPLYYMKQGYDIMKVINILTSGCEERGEPFI